MDWLHTNQHIQLHSRKANPGKFQFMVLWIKENDSFILNIGKNKIKNSAEATLLGVKTDKQLKLKSYIEGLCRKVANKLHGFRRISKHLTVEQAKFLANAFNNSQSTYAPLIWMFAGKSSVANICKMHFQTFVTSTVHMLCVVQTNSAISFYYLCNVSLMLHLYFVSLYFYFSSWYLLVYYAIFCPALNKDFNNNNDNNNNNSNRQGHLR